MLLLHFILVLSSFDFKHDLSKEMLLGQVIYKVLFLIQGNRLFKEGKYALAKAKYDKVYTQDHCYKYYEELLYYSHFWTLFYKPWLKF